MDRGVPVAEPDPAYRKLVQIVQKSIRPGPSTPPELRPSLALGDARPRFDPNAPPTPVNEMRLTASDPPPSSDGTLGVIERGSYVPVRQQRQGRAVAVVATGERYASSVKAAAQKLGLPHTKVYLAAKHGTPLPGGLVLKFEETPT